MHIGNTSAYFLPLLHRGCLQAYTAGLFISLRRAHFIFILHCNITLVFWAAETLKTKLHKSEAEAIK